MQTIIVGAIVLAAVAFIARRVWRSVIASRAQGSGCGDGCGCGTSDTPRRPA